jgi:hypothetical protein
MKRLLLLTLIAACSDDAPYQPAYQVACDTNDLEHRSVWKCVRIHTPSGEARYVDLDALRTIEGKASDRGPRGRCQLICNSTSVSTSASFRCLRLDTSTGDMFILDVDALTPVS